MELNPIFGIDFYKAGHVKQYRKGLKKIFVNMTPRGTRIPGQRHVVTMNQQFYVKDYLQHQFNEFFFKVPRAQVLAEYRELLTECLGDQQPDVSHIDELHKLGHLPIDIWAVPDGTAVGLNVPLMVMTNTRDQEFWLPNYLEDLTSVAQWIGCTSATKAQRMRAIMTSYAIQAGERDLSYIDYQGHDFSMRGMEGLEGCILSGMGHLTSFRGTDTVPAIKAIRKYYHTPLGQIGGSVPATEHSVVCAGGHDGEFETFRRLICDIYPTGILSLVSDTWDLWRVLTDYIPRLREQILARNGKIVIRPDSGDPVDIVCGDKSAPTDSPAYQGALRLLAQALGVEDSGMGRLPVIRNAAVIYGDSITEERCDAILNRCINELGLSPRNVVFGIGSYTYQAVTRDTHNFALKATGVIDEHDNVLDIFKAPVTDTSCKRSHRGIPCVYESEFGNVFNCVTEGNDPSMLDKCGFEKIFSDGTVLVDRTFGEVRENAAKSLPLAMDYIRGEK